MLWMRIFKMLKCAALPSHVFVCSCSGAFCATQVASWVAEKVSPLNEAAKPCVVDAQRNMDVVLSKARNADVVVAIDGCALHCLQWAFKKAGVSHVVHYDLHEMGLARKTGELGADQLNQAFQSIMEDLKKKKIIKFNRGNKAGKESQ